MTHRICSLLFLMLTVSASNIAFADIYCPPLESKYGNRDYLNSNNQKHLNMVENAHFNEDVRQLRGGARPSGSLIGDLQYTLNWFPNHHAALDTLVRLAIREQNPMPLGGKHIECRFQWATKVNPSDGMVKFIQARYYNEIGEQDHARRMLEKAAKLAPKNANVQYNIGLIYFRMKDFEASRRHAKIAYSYGFPLPGLRDMLEDEGFSLD